MGNRFAPARRAAPAGAARPRGGSPRSCRRRRTACRALPARAARRAPRRPAPGDFTRGTRPKISMMSQNSHWKGQPREVWSAWLAYAERSRRSNRGTRARPRSGRSSPSGERRRGDSGPGASSTRTSRSSRPSASPRNTWSASPKSWGAVLGAAPPTTVRRPIARARRSTPRIDSSWMSMPETRTTSAHARSASSSGATWRSRRRRSQWDGRSAASVAIPSGGYVAALPRNGRVCSKLQ